MTTGGSMDSAAVEKRLLRDIFSTFFKIGLFTFGGGFAMIPLIEREIVRKKRWIAAADIADVFAVAQSVPGAIAINSATFVGYKVAGRKGALAATFGVVLPSLLVITAIAAFFGRFQENPHVRNAFLGIRACIVGLIAMAGLSLTGNAAKKPFSLAILLCSLGAIVFFDVDAVAVIAVGIILGAAAYGVSALRRKAE
jgi:chromate transporter